MAFEAAYQNAGSLEHYVIQSSASAAGLDGMLITKAREYIADVDRTGLHIKKVAIWGSCSPDGPVLLY